MSVKTTQPSSSISTIKVFARHSTIPISHDGSTIRTAANYTSLPLNLQICTGVIEQQKLPAGHQHKIVLREAYAQRLVRLEPHLHRLALGQSNQLGLEHVRTSLCA
jgi:hypothetical protein